VTSEPADSTKWGGELPNWLCARRARRNGRSACLLGELRIRQAEIALAGEPSRSGPKFATRASAAAAAAAQLPSDWLKLRLARVQLAAGAIQRAHEY